MSTPSAATVMHRLKPLGYQDNPLAEQLRRLAADLQEQTDHAHALLAAVHQPADLAKGAVLEDWDGHEPLQLEVTEDGRGRCHLEDIRVRGVSVSEWLQGDLWDRAEEWMHEHLERGPTDSERRRVAQMDHRDLRAELAA